MGGKFKATSLQNCLCDLYENFRVFLLNIHLATGQTYSEDIIIRIMGQRYRTRDKQDKEIQRRITAGWTAFAIHIFKRNMGINMLEETRQRILSAMTDGVETWALTTQAKNKLAAAQTQMERSMLNITYRDR